MDAKYGRLFTEGDVQEIAKGLALIFRGDSPSDESINAALGTVLDHLDGKHETVPTRELTFPADEPLFVLRGKDQCAPSTIAAIEGEISRDYVGHCIDVGSPEDHTASVQDAAKQMRDWQIANPDLVKIPD